MKRRQAPETVRGSAAVSLTDGSIIICRLSGLITELVVQDSMRETKKYVDIVRSQGQAPRLLIDISDITSQTSGARSQAKRLADLTIDRIAVCGGGRALTAIGRYIARAGGMGDYTHFFAKESQALSWLKSEAQLIDRTADDVIIRRVIAVVILLVSMSVLIGWMTDLNILKSWIPGGNSMNPMNAVNFIVMAVLLFLFKRGSMSRARTILVALIGSWFIIWGSLIILRNAFGWDLPIDRALFSSKLQITNGVAPNTSLDYLLLGGIVLTILSGLRRLWQRYLFHILSVILVVTTLGAIFGMSFGLEQLYSGNFVPMAFNTAIVFLLFNHALQTLTNPLPGFAQIFAVVNKYWQPAVVLTAMLFAVGLAWQQSVQDVRRTHEVAVNEQFTQAKDAAIRQFDTYANVLRGYKGFIESSDFVSAKEYENFFLNSQPPGGHPGFTAISFIRYIRPNEQAKFVAEMKQQATTIPQYISYAISPKTDKEAYPLVYVQPYTAATNWGFNLGTSESRRTAFETARDSGQPTASGEIDLNASSTNPNAKKRKGFLVTIPIYKNGSKNSQPGTVSERRQQLYGFINTVFENGIIFPTIFDEINKDIKLTIANTKAESAAYTYSPPGHSFASTPSAETDIANNGQVWKLSLYAPDNFGLSTLASRLPYFVLAGGGLLALFAFAFLASQVRRREQALKLAESMTEDLQNERNAAVVARQKDEAILASIGDAVFAIDTKEKIMVFNAAAEVVSGYSSQEAVGRHFRDVLRFITEKDGKQSDAFIAQALSGHMAQMEHHTKLIRKDGSEVFVADSAAPVHDRSGDIVGAIVVFRDVSKEQELDKAKTEFVSLASHQLRTPLSAINWYGELLLSGDAGKLSKAQKEYIKEIHDGNQRMIELVNALLDVSRLELGKLSNQHVPNKVSEIIESIEKELTISITEKSLTLTKHLQAGLPAVLADPKLLRMIVQNLMSNAVKYTPPQGSVEVVLRRASVADMHITHLKQTSGSYIFMSVKDNGYGIPKTQQDKIFKKLFRADNVRALDVEGTGLGLYIVKEVVEKLGGRIWFDSMESVGTTFLVLLPTKTKVTKEADNAG